MYFLGIDIGGTMTKAALFDARGRQVSVCGKDTPQQFPEIGWVERDMDVLWEIAAACVRGAIEKAGISAAEVAAVGCTGHGKGLYLWGKDGKAAAPAIASTDHRAADIVRRWEKDGTADRAALHTLQRVRDCQPAALLRWFKEERPAVYANIAWVFEAKDYLRFRLTDEAYAEYTDYSGTSLMDMHTRAFEPAIFEAFGITEMLPCMPPLRRSYDVCGHVTAQAAQLTGLMEGTPVCGGMFDIDACAIAADVSQPDLLCVITGTWSINEYIAPAPAEGSPTTLNSLFCLPDYYLVEESSPTSVGNLEWLVREVLGESKAYFAQADRLVDELLPEASEVIFLPFLYGSNSPSVLYASFYGLNSSQDRAHLLRALFEGAAFSHRMHVDRLRKLNPNLSVMRLSGGAVNSTVWTQMFADVLGLPVEVIKAEEMGAKGAAMAAAVSIGEYADFHDAANNMVNITDTIYPDPSREKVYDKKYRRYEKLLHALEQAFAE